MDKKLNEKHAEITYDDEICEMCSDIVRQDNLNVKVLFFITKCEQSATQVTVKNISENVKSPRRVGVKDEQNALVSFANKEDYIDRKMAERIVDRLAYASLIYFDVQLPFKFIRLTARGAQVALKIHKKLGGN